MTMRDLESKADDSAPVEAAGRAVPASILLVEEDASVADTVAGHFRANGLVTAVAPSLESARLLSVSLRPTLIVVDMQPLGKAGLTFRRELRISPATASVTVIFVQKPFELDALFDRVRRCLSSTATEAAAPEAPAGHVTGDLRDALLFPGRAARLPASRRSAAGIAAVVAQAIGVGLQAGISRRSMVYGAAAGVADLVIAGAVLATVAWTLQWRSGLLRESLSFRDLLARLAMALVPVALGTWLGAAYVALGGQPGEFTAGPLLAMPAWGVGSVGFVLRHIDIFEIWSLALALRWIALARPPLRGMAARWIAGFWTAWLVGGAIVAGM